MARQGTACETLTETWNWPAARQEPADSRASTRSMPRGRRVLLILGEAHGAETFTQTLRALHVESTWARTGMAAVAATRTGRFDLVFVDLDLPDTTGAALIRRLRADDRGLCCVIVSGVINAAVTREALHLGALGVLGKPLHTSDITLVMHAVFGPNGAQAHGVAATPMLAGAQRAARLSPGSTAERWAMLMFNTIRAEADPKTINSWARAVGLSRSVLCECCRLIHVSPHDARDFARLMRVICRSGPRWQPETLLDLADARTLKKLLIRAGLTEPIARTPSAREFFDKQQWISHANPGLRALRALLVGDDAGAEEQRESEPALAVPDNVDIC